MLYALYSAIERSRQLSSFCLFVRVFFFYRVLYVLYSYSLYGSKSRLFYFIIFPRMFTRSWKKTGNPADGDLLNRFKNKFPRIPSIIIYSIILYYTVVVLSVLSVVPRSHRSPQRVRRTRTRLLTTVDDDVDEEENHPAHQKRRAKSSDSMIEAPRYAQPSSRLVFSGPPVK